MDQVEIGIIHTANIPAELFEPFRDEAQSAGISVFIETRPSAGPFAGVAWLLPTAVMLFVTRKYFDALLSEMGKDHYQILKSATRKLSSMMNAVKVTVISSSPGKAAGAERYSLAYSIWSNIGGRRVKFLLPVDCTDKEVEEASDAIFDFIARAEPSDLPDEDGSIATLILLAFDAKQGSLVVVDPLADIRTTKPL